MPGKHRKPRPHPIAVTMGVSSAAVVALMSGTTPAVTAEPAATAPTAAVAVARPVAVHEERWLAGVPHGAGQPIAPAAIPGPAPETSGGDRAARAVSAALSARGTPYKKGGDTPGRGLDCSGLSSYAFRQAGITLPRRSRDQAKVGRPVAVGNLQPGDLVFYYKPVSHVVVYIGNNEIVQASKPGTRVAVRKLYLNGFAGARRVS